MCKGFKVGMMKQANRKRTGGAPRLTREPCRRDDTGVRSIVERARRIGLLDSLLADRQCVELALDDQRALVREVAVQRACSAPGR